MRAPATARTRVLAALFTGLLVVLAAGCSSAPSGSGGGASTSRSTSPGAASSTAAPDGPEQRVVEAIRRLDRRAQVAQLFVAGVRLDDLSPGEQLAASGVGGIFLAGRSQAAAADLAAVTSGWQTQAPGPALWVAADQEGGQVQTLKGPGFEPLPPAVEQGALPPDQLTGLADGLGAALQSAGINLDLAPVADVVPAGAEAGNPPIGAFGRQYGSTGDAVIAAAGSVMDGLAAHDVTPTLKHFPGLGRVTANTDTTANVTDDVTTADDDQVRAFGTLLASPADPFVMMSSAVYSRIDPSARAAFSPTIISGLLRERLGFDGVIISDDLANARAVRDLQPEERAMRFLAAGGTIVLSVDASIVPGMIDAVVQRSDADPAFAATVDAAVRTALLAKARAGLLPAG
jgi:beta-glucosidase-like glycosyl hydrolase